MGTLYETDEKQIKTKTLKGCLTMPHIYGDRIALREYQLSDLDYMRRWVNDPEITNTLSDVFLFPHSKNETESFLSMMVEGKSSAKSFVIADKDSLDYIGQIDLFKIDWKNRFALLAVVIGRKEYLGKGYGSEAIRILQRFAFEELNLNRIELEVYEYNERAYKCYLKCGFKEEGRYRKKIYRVGKYWDSICMSILRSEYEQA
jgi:RimJ/RimL family protein N-acetyltransferase